MQRRYKQFNVKRKMKEPAEGDLQQYAELAEEIRYGGNPEHKLNPLDYGLTPPSGPRPGKSLCDTIGKVTKLEALDYFKSGVRKGMVSDRFCGKWPQNIWAVAETGEPLEAQLENQATGTYHGYPLPQSDPWAAEIVRQWKMRK